MQNPDINYIKAVGFYSWAANAITNEVEHIDLFSAPVNIVVETDSVIFTAQTIGDAVVCNLRAYIDGMGWQTHERIIKPYGRAGRVVYPCPVLSGKPRLAK